MRKCAGTRERNNQSGRWRRHRNCARLTRRQGRLCYCMIRYLASPNSVTLPSLSLTAMLFHCHQGRSST
jgi:hypothetical protein